MNSKIAAITLGAAAIAVVLVFLLLPGPEPAAPPASKPQAGSETDANSNPLGDAGRDQHEFATAFPSGPQGSTPSGSAAPQAEEEWEPWEDKLDELLTSDADNATTVRGLVNSMRGLSAEAQEEFVAHAVNLCEDEQFGVLEEIYYNSATPTEVSETIFNDALNRPDEIKLPMLAKTLRNPTHPMAQHGDDLHFPRAGQ